MLKYLAVGLILLVGLSILAINLGETNEASPVSEFNAQNCTPTIQTIIEERNVTVEKPFFVNRNITQIVTVEKNLTGPNFTAPDKNTLKELIKDSHVSGKAWKNDTYDCTEFSNDLIAYLRDQGIFACTVEINFKSTSGGHIFVATKLEDGRLFYIEPQNAELIESKYLKVGDNYCDWVDWSCNWTISRISSCFGFEAAN
jgi:hypothetical protein